MDCKPSTGHIRTKATIHQHKSMTAATLALGSLPSAALSLHASSLGLVSFDELLYATLPSADVSGRLVFLDVAAHCHCSNSACMKPDCLALLACFQPPAASFQLPAHSPLISYGENNEKECLSQTKFGLRRLILEGLVH